MSLERAKRIARVILTESTTSQAILLSHNVRAALADLAAELVDLNQRLDLLENGKGDADGKV